MRIGRNCRDHSPVRNIAQRVDHVQKDEHYHKQNHKYGRIYIYKPEKACKHHHQQYRRNQPSDELPYTEPAPPGICIINQVAQQRVQKISAIRITTTNPVITEISRAASDLSTLMNRAVVTYVMKKVLIVL